MRRGAHRERIGAGIRAGVRRLFRLPLGAPRRTRADADDELEAYLAERVDDLIRRGMSHDAARAEALRRLGAPLDVVRDALHQSAERREDRKRWRGALADALQDVRFAARQFAKAPALTAVAVLTLALGIGANAAIFSVVHRLLIAPLPYADGDRIVRLVLRDGDDVRAATYEMVKSWHERARSFELMSAVSVNSLALQDFGEASDTIQAQATSNYLTLLGLRPALGRDFSADDERPGAPPVAMISYGRWQRVHGGRADVLGATVRAPDYDQRLYTIVGVMPKETAVPMSTAEGVNKDLRAAQPAIWLPASFDSIAGDRVFAKLRAGISAEAASRELQAIFESDRGTDTSHVRPQAMRAQDFLDPREAQTVRVLFVAVGVLLLIACANVANLLMARAWARRREFAVRTSLGAGRARLIRQILTESSLLALGGGLLGLGVAWLTLKVILALRPRSLESLAGVHVEPAVLWWSAGVSVATGLLFGCAPALFAGRRSPGDVLRNETRGASGGAVARRLRSTLTVLEIALSLVLLVGAGLLVRSFVALQRMPLNFQPRGLVFASVLMQFRRDWTLEQRHGWRNDVIGRLRAIPGVTDISIGMLPGLGWRALATQETDPGPDGHVRSVPEVSTTFVSSNYFRATGMRMVAGRIPDSLASTREGKPREIVVNQSLARRLWPDGRAVGARLIENLRGRGPNEISTVVGVVEDIQMPGRRGAATPFDVYGPMPPRVPFAPVLLRTALPEQEITAAIRSVVAEFDRDLRAATGMPIGAVVQSITPGDRYLDDSLAPTRFAMVLLTAFAAVALVLAAVGLYGVIAYGVTQRTRELGVRLALGARPRSIATMVIGDGVRLAAGGILIGVAASATATRVLRSMLYGVGPADALTFAGITTLVAAITLAASYIPARRAVRVDPTEALRAD